MSARAPGASQSRRTVIDDAEIAWTRGEESQPASGDWRPATLLPNMEAGGVRVSER